MIKRFILFVLLLILVLRVGLLIHAQRTRLIPDYWARYSSLKDIYGSSQYVMKAWKNWIPDETVYSYAAGAYIKGANPIIIEPTQPPLGKYLIGLSILATNNENSIIVLFYVLLLVGIAALTFQITKNTVISLFVAMLASFQNLFSDQLSSTPLLDIFLITFVLFALIVTVHAIDRKKPVYLLLSYGLLGAALMVKVWLIGAVFVLSMTGYILLKHPKYILYVCGGFCLMLCILLMSYYQMFAAGYNVMEVLKVQKWLYWYQAGKQNRLFLIWPLIFLNRWYVWWGESAISYDPNWSLSWPLLIGTGMLASIKILWNTYKRKIVTSALSLCAFSILLYSMFISLGQPSARYLLPLLPLCYCLVGWCLQLFFRKNTRLAKYI